MMKNFFISKIEGLRDGFNASNDIWHPSRSSSQPATKKDTMVLSPPSPAVVIQAIGNLNRTDVSGKDGSTVSVLQLAAPISAMPIAHLIALSFAQAKVPTAFKAAIVVPIHKGKGKPANQPYSYRLVVILLTLSKVLEKVVLLQLTPSLEDKLSECQFGFLSC